MNYKIQNYKILTILILILITLPVKAQVVNDKLLLKDYNRNYLGGIIYDVNSCGLAVQNIVLNDILTY